MAYNPEIDTLEFRLEAALRTYLLSCNIAGKPNIYTGEETEDRQLPAINCECHGGPEHPMGTNNFLLSVSVCIISNVDPTNSDADPFPLHRRLVKSVKWFLWDSLLGPNAEEELHTVLSAQVPFLQVQNEIQFHGSEIHLHDRKMMTELKFTMQAFEAPNGVENNPYPAPPGPPAPLSLTCLIAIPCNGPASGGCACAAGSVVSNILPGAAGITFTYTFRCRGVVELKTYTGGAQNGLFYTGGPNANDGNANSYGLVICDADDAPDVTYNEGQYFLNASTGGAGRYQCNAIDYNFSITAVAGQAIVLTTDSFDGGQADSPEEEIPDISAPAQPYDGQFLRLDLVSAVPVN